MTPLGARTLGLFLLFSCAEKPAQVGPLPTTSAPAAPIATATATSFENASADAEPLTVADAHRPKAQGNAVRVTNIGMHIGGGPNDVETKAPIANSVAPHFSKLAECYASTTELTKTGDFGVDLMVEANGGRAKVSHPRTSLASDSFKACVVAAFEAIDFQKPKGGRTMVSYSLRFEPRS
jgi:hypothetical protein